MEPVIYLEPDVIHTLKKDDQSTVTIRRLNTGQMVMVKSVPTLEEANHEYSMNKKAAMKCGNNMVKAKRIIGKDIIFELTPDYVTLERLRFNLNIHIPLHHKAFYILGLYLSQALRCFMENDLIHSDVKPSNILFDPDHHHVKMIDFGFMRVLSSQEARSLPEIQGSLAYMSPFLFTSLPIRHRVVRNELWSMVCTLMDLLHDEKSKEAEPFNDRIFCESLVNLDDLAQLQMLIARVSRWFQRIDLLQKKQIKINTHVDLRAPRLHRDTRALLKQMLALESTKDPFHLLKTFESHCQDMIKAIRSTESILRRMIQSMATKRLSDSEKELSRKEKHDIHMSLVEQKEEDLHRTGPIQMEEQAHAEKIVRMMHPEKPPVQQVMQPTLLGKGGYGKVYAYEEKGVPLAIKKLQVDMKRPGQVFNEINVMHNVEHPYLMSAKEIRWNDTGKPEVGIVMDRALSNAMQWKFEHAAQIKLFMKQTLVAICALHQKHMIHFDIKPENFLVMHSKLIRVADFGLISFMCQSKYFYFLQGTMKYMPPEVVRKIMLHRDKASFEELFAIYSDKADAWAYVMSWFFMLGDARVFVGAHQKPKTRTSKAGYMMKWLRDKFQYQDVKKAYIQKHIKDPVLQDFFYRNLVFREADRPNCMTLLNDPFFNASQEMIPISIRPWPHGQGVVIEYVEQRKQSFQAMGVFVDMMCDLFQAGPPRNRINEVNFVTIQAYLFFQRIQHDVDKGPETIDKEMRFLCSLIAFVTFFPRLRMDPDMLDQLELKMLGRKVQKRWPKMLSIFRGLGQNMFGLHMSIMDWSSFLQSSHLDQFLMKAPKSESGDCYEFTQSNSLVQLS